MTSLWYYNVTIMSIPNHAQKIRVKATNHYGRFLYRIQCSNTANMSKDRLGQLPLLHPSLSFVVFTPFKKCYYMCTWGQRFTSSRVLHRPRVRRYTRLRRACTIPNLTGIGWDKSLTCTMGVLTLFLIIVLLFFNMVLLNAFTDLDDSVNEFIDEIITIKSRK